MAESEPAGSASSSPASSRGSESGGRLIRAGQIAGALTALATAVALLWNDVLKPAPAPAVLSVTLTHLEAHAGVTLRNYLNSHASQLAAYEAHAKAAEVEPAEVNKALAAPGVLVEYAVTMQGPAGRRVNGVYTVYEAGSEARVDENAVKVTPGTYVSHAGLSVAPQGAWIEMPARAGSYYVEVELLGKGGEAVAHARTQPFGVSHARR